jgi:hypothetical protein
MGTAPIQYRRCLKSLEMLMVLTLLGLEKWKSDVDHHREFSWLFGVINIRGNIHNPVTIQRIEPTDSFRTLGVPPCAPYFLRSISTEILCALLSLGQRNWAA